jgi:hypothetical protein
MVAILEPIKQNVEVLTGQRGALGADSTALLKGAVTVNPLSRPPAFINATGAAVSIQGVPLASGDDYVRAVQDLQLLRNDMQAIVDTLNALIVQLRG